METGQDLNLMGDCLSQLGEMLKEKARNGKITADSRIHFLNTLSSLMRLGQVKNQNNLMKPADGKRDALLTGRFADTLSQVLLSYADSEAFSQNLQTDLKNKARELTAFLEQGEKS